MTDQKMTDKNNNDVKSEGDDHWLVRPANIRLLWWVFIGILGMTVVADFFVHHHHDFALANNIGFGAWFGFASCVVLVILSKALGVLLKKRDDYYGR